MRTPLQSEALLKRLHQAGVDFVLIGGVAATLYGAAEPTTDLDLCVRFDLDNARRLLVALANLRIENAHNPTVKALPENPASLLGFRNLYLNTELGRLDMLSEVPPLGGLEQLKASAEIFLLEDRPIQIISLDGLIAVKEFVRRPKDLVVASQLKAIRDRLRSGPLNR